MSFKEEENPLKGVKVAGVMDEHEKTEARAKWLREHGASESQVVAANDGSEVIIADNDEHITLPEKLTF